MFEATFHYYDRNEESKGFDHSESKKYKKVIGKVEDDVPLEELAQAIMKQLARRDIFVHDYEIFEYTKKKINSRETKGGILIKGMKFSLDNDEIKCIAEEVAPTPESQPASPIILPSQGALRSRLLGGGPAQPRGQNQAKVASRMEIFFPDDAAVVEELAQKNIKLTMNKKYPIYEERPCKILANFPGSGPQEMNGYNYVVMDDTANFVEVSSVHFTPEQRGLVGMSPTVLAQAQAIANRASGPRLLYMNQDNPINSMPVLRRV